MTAVSRVKETLADLKGARGTLKVYFNQTSNEETRVIYQDALGSLDEIITVIKQRVSEIEMEKPQ